MFHYFGNTCQQWNKNFKKPQKSGNKANEKQRKRKKTPEIFVESVQKDEKRTRIDDPNVQPQSSIRSIFPIFIHINCPKVPRKLRC